MTQHILPIVLSGGAGTRLWPASRRRQPKQLLQLVDDRSMFLMTVQRAAALPDTIAPIVVSGEDQRIGIQRELATAGLEGSRMMLEPVGRNTAPAVAVAAIDATATGEDPLLLVLPADHVIGDEAALADAVTTAARLAAEGYLVTFGITPAAPETGYGYIETGDDLGDGAMAVVQFREKPDADTAERYLAAGGFLWNSGMFLFRASRYLEELDRHEPSVLNAAYEALAGGKEDGGVITLDRDALLQAPSISIDYAVMEPTDRAAVVPLDAGWSDVGSWQALWDLGERDEHGNVIAADVEVLDVTNSYIRGGERLIAAIGVHGVVIVDSPDAVLVADRDRVQDVKAIVDRLGEADRGEIETNGTEARPWGRFSTVVSAPGLRVARLWMEPGGVTASRTHDRRSEYWIVVDGIARIIVGDTSHTVAGGESAFVPAGSAHHLENASDDERLELMQITIDGGRET